MDSWPGFGPVHTWNSAENTTQPLPSWTRLQVSKGTRHYRQWVKLILSLLLEGDVAAATAELWHLLLLLPLDCWLSQRSKSVRGPRHSRGFEDTQKTFMEPGVAMH